MDILKKLAVSLAALGLAAALGGTAQAGAVLKISDGITTVTIQDNGAGDTNATIGWISTNYSIGGLTGSVGAMTKPAIGATDKPWMHLHGAAAGIGDLSVMFTDTDFDNASGGAFNSSIGGITYGEVDYRTYGDAGNTDFGMGTALGDLGTFTSTAFSGQSTDPLLAFGPFSLTMLVEISHGATSLGLTSFNADLRAVPEPATLGLLGLGLLGFGAMRRYRKRA